MTPSERIKQRAEELMREGCTPDKAFQRALQERDNRTSEQSEILDQKHESEMALEEWGSKKKRSEEKEPITPSEEKKDITSSNVIPYLVVVIVIVFIIIVLSLVT